jgi:uncharacterized protein YpmS
MNTWKKFALVMLSLLIIVAGIRFAYVETHTFKLNEGQKAFATKATLDGLSSEIVGKDHNVNASDRGWIISTSSGDRKVVPVVLTYENTTFSALVDMETGDVVRKSKVEYSGWMTEYKYPERWSHKRFFE